MAEDVVMEMVFLKSAIPKKSETVMERRCRVTEPQASVGAVIVNLENLPGEQIRFLVLSEVLRKVFSKKEKDSYDQQWKNGGVPDFNRKITGTAAGYLLVRCMDG